MSMKGWTTVAIREELSEQLKAVHKFTGEREDMPTRVVEELIRKHLRRIEKTYDMKVVMEEYRQESETVEP